MEIGWKTHEKFFGFISVVAILIIVDIGWKSHNSYKDKVGEIRRNPYHNGQKLAESKQLR